MKNEEFIMELCRDASMYPANKKNIDTSEVMELWSDVVM